MKEARAHILRNMGKYLLLFLVAGISLGFVLSYYGVLATTMEKLSYFGYTTMVFSILFAAIQFRATHDWNRRQLAMTAAREVKISHQADTETLNKVFSFVTLNHHQIISVDAIHKAMCVLDKDGNCQMGTDGKLVLDHDKPVRKAIFRVLNDYEHLAVGVHQRVYDEEIIKALFRGVIVKTYGVFKDYIEHYNTRMAPERQGKIWINLKFLAQEFAYPDNAGPDKREAAG